MTGMRVVDIVDGAVTGYRTAAATAPAQFWGHQPRDDRHIVADALASVGSLWAVPEASGAPDYVWRSLTEALGEGVVMRPGID